MLAFGSCPLHTYFILFSFSHVRLRNKMMMMILILLLPVLCFLLKMSICQNVALKECFYRTTIEDLLYEYVVNYSLSLSAVDGAVFFVIRFFGKYPATDVSVGLLNIW